MKSALPKNEAARLEALYQYQILDTEPEEAFDDITRLAAHICGTPIALINFINANRQWVKSKVGLDVTEAPRDVGLCPLCIQKRDVVIISDTLADEQSRANPVVTSYPNIRFYAGAPLITPDEHAIGTLCVLDHKPRQLSLEQVEALRALSRQVVNQLELRRNLATLARTTTDYKQAQEAMRKAGAENLRLAGVVASVSDGVTITDPNQPDNPIIYTNPAFSRITGYQPEEIIGCNCRFLQGSGTDPQTVAEIRQAIAERREVQVTLLNYRKDGQPFWNELKISPVFSDEGELLYFVGIQTDITKRKSAENLLVAQKRVLEMIASGASLSDVLETLTQTIEEHSRGMLCSILLLDQNGINLRHGAAPSLPEDYNRAMDGMSIGSSVGSCGAAAYLGKPVIVSDIASDSLWINFRDLALSHGLRACWSTPIFSTKGSILGTFAIYYRQPKNPSAQELQVIEIAAHIAGIAIERQRAEEALRQNEEKFRNLVEQTNDWVWQIDSNGVFTYVSPKARDIVGYEPEEIIGKTTFDLMALEEVQRFSQVLSEFISKQQPFTRLEKTLIRKDGSSIVLETSGSPVFDRQGVLQGYCGIARDITERKRAEEQLQESKKRFQLVARATNDAIWDWNLVTNEVWWNDGIYTLFHYSPSDVEPDIRWWYEHIHPEDRQRVVSGIHAAIASGEQYWADEYRFIRADGSAAYVFDRGHILYDDRGKPIRAIAGMTDISDRKQAEQKIREQAALLNITTEAILVRDLDNQILFWNKGAERLYGWKAEEALGKNANECLYKETCPELEEALKTVLEKGEWYGELHQVTKDGKHIIVTSRWTLVRDEAEKPTSILTVNTDITEKKQLEEQFLRAQRLESIGTLAGGIAHDLNNVLAPILMSVQILKRKLNDRQTQQVLTTLETSAKRGANLVKQVLSFARGVEGKRTTLQIGHLISEIGKIAKETFPKSIEVCTDISTRDLWAISGDATQLHQVLMNLCVNARDAMPEGGTLSITAENLFIDENYARMNLEAKVGPYVVITVLDTGTGIPPEILDRIFEPFFTTKEVGKGTGLGLSTTIGIIKSHDGFVTVASSAGRGTQFKVYLPAVETTVTRQETEDLELPSGNGELILVVDDEASIREVTKTSLETFNYQTMTASDGIEAIALYAQHKNEISVVLVDMMMPSMDGTITIRTLQKMNPQIKIIAMSGLSLNEKLSETIANSIQAFLLKPYTAQELLQTVYEVKNAQL